jgi:intracellular multiplication protein IcmL
MVDENVIKEDVVLLVYARNEFYKKKFHWVLGVCCLGLLVIIALSGMLRYITRNPVHPLYFVADKAGRLIQDIPLDMPNMSVADVEQWAVEAVVAANTYDFANYHGQLQLAQKYFTDFGWRNYMKGLQASNNLVALTQRKLIFTARASGAPRLLNQGRVGKARLYAWQISIPVVVTYLMPPYDGVLDKTKFENSFVFTVLIMRQSLLTSYKGLGISQIIGASTAAAGSDLLLPTPPS